MNSRAALRGQLLNKGPCGPKNHLKICSTFQMVQPLIICAEYDLHEYLEPIPMYMCVGLSRWTEGQCGWNKVTTETRVSKHGRPNQETLHFQVSLIQGYHINLTLLSERLHRRI